MSSDDLGRAAPAARLPERARWPTLQGLLPGGALAGVIAMAASYLALQQGGPVFLYALFFGIAFHHLSGDPSLRPGIDFCARSVLRLGVGLLGARITATQIAGLGWPIAIVVVLAVASTVMLGMGLGRRFGLTRAQGGLAGGAVAICGASAALALSAVLPRGRPSERFTLMVVLAVTVLSTVAMVLYPLIARALELPPQLAALFIGGSIHDVAQVVGAGYTLGNETGDLAMVVKLLRVSLLALVVLALSVGFLSAQKGEDRAGGGRPPLVPWFLWLFVFLVLANSAGIVPALVQPQVEALSRACLVVAIAALGVKTSFKDLAQAGWRPLLLLGIETLWIAGFMLGAALLLRAY